MKRLLIVLFVLCIGLPFASAQDTPTADVATLESTPVETATPIETATPVPTETSTPEPTATPIPVPDPDPTPTEPGLSKTEIILIGALFVVAAMFAIFGGVLASFANKLLNAAPEWVADIIRLNAERGLAELRERAGETPNTLDDDLVERIALEVAKLLRDDFRGNVTRPASNPPLGTPLGG